MGLTRMPKYKQPWDLERALEGWGTAGTSTSSRGILGIMDTQAGRS